jgi:hypothetical protein
MVGDFSFTARITSIETSSPISSHESVSRGFEFINTFVEPLAATAGGPFKLQYKILARAMNRYRL